MPRLKLTPAGIASELGQFQAKFASGLGTLKQAADASIGSTPRELIHKIDDVCLYRYVPSDLQAQRIPLLIVYALVNRPDMVDLQADRSLVATLIDQGFEVYLIDWGEPSRRTATLGLSDYILGYLDNCVDYLLERLGRKRINLFGICQGGTFSACYSALQPEKIDRLITTVTPIDFRTPDDMISHIVQSIDIDAFVDANGDISGDLLNSLFLSLKPFRLLQQKYVQLISQLDDLEAVRGFLRMEQWIFDSPALGAKVSREFGRDFYQQNLLVSGGLRIGGKAVELRRIERPVFNCFAANDHLVPPAASKALAQFIDVTRYTECELPGGHIGIYVSPRSSAMLASRLNAWFSQGP